MAIEFKRDKDGNLIAYKNGKRVGAITTMGDDLWDKEEDSRDTDKQKE